MDLGQLISVCSRLVLCALSAFFAIYLLSRTRDKAWMLIIAGAVTAYVGAIFSILEIFGITTDYIPAIGSVSLAGIVFEALPVVFLITAFLVMINRNYR